jgi:thiol-disulfide isomerase/thioredoxin
MIFISFSALVMSQRGYRINMEIEGLRDTNVILGHYLAAQALYPTDTIRLDKNGHGLFSKKKDLPQGLYFLYFPNGKPLDIFIGEDQNFSVSLDTADYFESLNIKGSLENTVYLGYIRQMNTMNAEMEKLQQQLFDTLDTGNKDKIKARVQVLVDKRKSLIRDINRQYPNLLVTAFLNATLEETIPDSLKKNQQEAYAYAKTHYFDNFDITDPRLLYTPLYDAKIKNYLDRMVVQSPDSLIKEIDHIMNSVLNDSTLFEHVLISLFSKYHKSEYMGMDAVVVHIAEQYYLEKAWWATEKSLEEIKDWVETTKPILIGQKAPDFLLLDIPSEHFKAAANDTALKRAPHVGTQFDIYSMKADYLVLYFWSPSCSHCKKDVPLMHKAYEEQLKSKHVTVIAINTLSSKDGKEKWVDFVNNHQLYDWINAWYPYDYKYKETYDIRTTPQIFVLNKDKKIIAKKIGSEQISDFIDTYNRIYPIGSPND